MIIFSATAVVVVVGGGGGGFVGVAKFGEVFGGQDELDGKRESDNRVLIDESGQTAEYGLVAAALDAHTRCCCVRCCCCRFVCCCCREIGGLDEEVAHELVGRIGAALELHVGGRLVDLDGEAVGAREVVAVAYEKGTRRLVAD